MGIQKTPDSTKNTVGNITLSLFLISSYTTESQENSMEPAQKSVKQNIKP